MSAQVLIREFSKYFINLAPDGSASPFCYTSKRNFTTFDCHSIALSYSSNKNVTEAKAKVVTAGWGAELIESHVTLEI